MQIERSSWSIAIIATALCKVREQVLLSQLSRYLWSAESQFGITEAHWVEWPYSHSYNQKIFTMIRTHLYTCASVTHKKHLIVNHWTLAKKPLDRNVSFHIAKFFLFWDREQEFVVRCGNSLTMTFRNSNWIRIRGQLPHSCTYNDNYTDDPNHHHEAGADLRGRLGH